MRGAPETGVVHITAGLLDALLELARETDPDDVTVVLAATPAGEFEASLSLDPSVPVLTHFYFPGAGASVASVFGMDLGTPSGRGRARFVSHPNGRLEVTRTDDLAAIVLVAVPPWDRDDVAAFDRSDRQLDLVVVDAEPPTEELVG